MATPHTNSPLSGYLPAAWQRLAPPAWRRLLPDGDWVWTIQDGQVQIAPGSGACPRCGQPTAQWHWDQGWVGSCCAGDVPEWDPAVREWVAWMEEHRAAFVPWADPAVALGDWTTHSVIPARVDRARWQPHWPRWRALGYLQCHEANRYTTWMSWPRGSRRPGGPTGHRVVRVTPAVWSALSHGYYIR